jgi:hypothetical protein
MSKPNLCDLSQNLQAGFGDLAITERRPADVEMARVLKTAPLRMASDPSSGTIAHWRHGALHDVVEPMVDHVVMTYPSGAQRLERRNGKSVAIGTARSGDGDDHSCRLKRPMGYSRACQLRPTLSSAYNARTGGRRSRSARTGHSL